MASIGINKPDADWKVMEKSIKSIQYLFGDDCNYSIWFYGHAFDAKTKEVIFCSGVPAHVREWKYTTRTKMGIKLLAEIDGAYCWILPDENYSYDIVFTINQD